MNLHVGAAHLFQEFRPQVAITRPRRCGGLDHWPPIDRHAARSADSPPGRITSQQRGASARGAGAPAQTAGEETSGRSSTSSHHAAPTPAQPENTMMDKRTFLKQAWVWPVIATFAVTPSMARAGSNDVEAEAETTWTIDYTVRGDISQVNKFYGTGAYLFLKTPDSIPVYLQQGGWQYQGVYGHVMLPDGLPAISFVGPYDQAIASRP